MSALVQIPDPNDEGGPFTYPAEKVWPHRVVVTVDGKTIFDMSIAEIILCSAARCQEETRLDLKLPPK